MFQKEYFYLGFDNVSPLYMPYNGENNYSIHYQHVVTEFQSALCIFLASLSYVFALA